MTDTNNTAVTVSLNDLQNGTVAFETLEQAFGPDSLGIILVKDLPSTYVNLRRDLLSYSSYLANLPPEELAKLESPASKWLVGWSCGKETLKDGRFDTLKGSYYVNCNPSFRSSATQMDLQSRYPSFPEYTAPNVWPHEDILPGFEQTFTTLCDLILGVAQLVARSCDAYALAKIGGYKAGYLERVVKSSHVSKARLLHYFPPPSSTPAAADRASTKTSESTQDDQEDDWCGTHLDHDCLTGLTSAMFVDEADQPPHLDGTTFHPLKELDAPPDPNAGLYIRSRAGNVIKVKIPRDCLAFQTGEALELITRGKFRAVPHFVRGAAAGKGGRVARNTLAVFTQPNLWEMVDETRDFAAFARGVVEKNH